MENTVGRANRTFINLSRKRKLVALLFGVIPFSILLLAGCATCGNVAFDKTDTFQTYQQNCAGCHGQQMEGKIGPDLRKIGSKLTPDQLKQVIENGALGMPAFNKRLDQKQVTALIGILSSEK